MNVEELFVWNLDQHTSWLWLLPNEVRYEAMIDRYCFRSAVTWPSFWSMVRELVRRP